MRGVFECLGLYGWDDSSKNSASEVTVTASNRCVAGLADFRPLMFGDHLRCGLDPFVGDNHITAHRASPHIARRSSVGMGAGGTSLDSRSQPHHSLVRILIVGWITAVMFAFVPLI